MTAYDVAASNRVPITIEANSEAEAADKYVARMRYSGLPSYIADLKLPESDLTVTPVPPPSPAARADASPAHRVDALSPGWEDGLPNTARALGRLERTNR